MVSTLFRVFSRKWRLNPNEELIGVHLSKLFPSRLIENQIQFFFIELGPIRFSWDLLTHSPLVVEIFIRINKNRESIVDRIKENSDNSRTRIGTQESNLRVRTIFLDLSNIVINNENHDTAFNLENNYTQQQNRKKKRTRIAMAARFRRKFTRNFRSLT